MPPKAKIPAPIDRPLSRAYLREFKGWSTAYPPGISDPTSLRIMENVQINRDGSARIRPGLRMLTREGATEGVVRPPVGSYEPFFLNNGQKAYLLAVREEDQAVSFRVAIPNVDGYLVVTNLAAPGVEFQADNYAVISFSAATRYVKYLQIDNKILALSDAGETPFIFEVGVTKKAYRSSKIDVPWTVRPGLLQPSPDWINGAQTGFPLPLEEPGEDALLGGGDYRLGVFLTFSTVFGESMPSKPHVVRMKRGRSSWSWNAPAPDGSPSPGEPIPLDPKKAADQLLATVPAQAYNDAKAAGATHINFYAASWSDQQPWPVEALLVEKLEIIPGAAANDVNQLGRITPENRYADTLPWPQENNRINATDIGKPSQGLVAADRLVLVRDREDGAKIRWTSNLMGEYTNFTPTKGGGFKTLTSGNMNVAVCAKLWQNPESKDTVTLLCDGVDSYSTAYYMGPAQVASQSDAVNIMGFEETTATPGTVSPYGVEVVNNGLYHPLEHELMKSTASNYNINHKTQTELIADRWALLQDKQWIVSSEMDNRIYYIVHNPYGAALRPGALGNEIWVLDTAAENGHWSRWLIQACSLRKIEFRDRVYMSVITPEGIFALDGSIAYDESIDHSAYPARPIKQSYIPWKLETNTQGANRAHDAWAHLQQVTATFGNFSGSVRWGVRGADIYGEQIERAKLTHVPPDPTEENHPLPWDVTDHLMVQRDMMEWFFFAESVGADAELLPSAGQINLVQYRYTPVSVNVGYEYGSVETFEYGRTEAGLPSLYTSNGVPVPGVNTARP